MNILVCWKQVAYICSRLGLDSRGEMDPDALVYIPNPYDEAALEEALRIRESSGGGGITLISVGPSRVRESLEYALAMGADHAIHVCVEGAGEIGPDVVARIISAAIQTSEYDLILCGRKAIDDNGGIVGGVLAELLDMPFVSSTTEIEILTDQKSAKMQQVLERGDRQVIECRIPAVLSVERGRFRPRYPTVAGRMAARAKMITETDPETLGVGDILTDEPEFKATKLTISRPKPKKMFTPDSSLSPEERIKMLMSGGTKEKKTPSADESSQDPVGRFMDFMVEHRIIRREN